MDKDKKIENGDFQTPIELTDPICKFLYDFGLRPKIIVEPTCGIGNFIASSLQSFPSCEKIYGFDIEGKYIDELKAKYQKNKKVILAQQDFFKYDWDNFVLTQTEPILFIGNPPWVTNSKIGSLKGTNLPAKTNFQKLDGFDALTGKSNFDISEWMLLKIISAFKQKSGYIAMLCKTSVARKVLTYCWKNSIHLAGSKIVHIDAHEGFDVSVDACLLLMTFDRNLPISHSADIIDDFESTPRKTIGYSDGILVSDFDMYKKHNDLLYSVISDNRWRTGIKHDCSKVMELKKKTKNVYVNGFGEEVELEDTYIYPLMKSSDIANDREPHRWVIVTQKTVNEPTDEIKTKAPLTWKYLTNHKEFFEKRVSKIYVNRPAFSIFGVGVYTFYPWKIAISGFYKSTTFRLVGTYEDKPVIFDDTVNFLAYQDYKVAKKDLERLNSKDTQNLTNSLTFWDAKRPITTALLGHLVQR